MHTTLLALSRASLKSLRLAALLATLNMVGVFGAQAGEAGTISLAQPVCLSCAFENGLPRTPATAALAVEAKSLETDDSIAGEVVDDGSSFGGSTTERSRIVLPERTEDRSERPRWSRGEKALVWSLVSLSAVDAYQTMNAPDHVREANPLLGSWAGDHPSELETVLFKGATTYGLIKLTSRIKKRSHRRMALALMNIIQLSVAAHNERVTGGILF